MGEEASIQHSVSADGAVHTLLFANGKGNILDIALCQRLTAQLAEIAQVTDARLVVLRGAGGNFSFGASVVEHLPEQAPEMLAALGALVQQLVDYPLPTLAAVEGRCLGGGFELALACGLLLAGEDAAMGCPEIHLGVFAPAATALLAGALPRARVEELLLTGRTLRAEEALQWGLVNRVVPTGEMDDAITAFAGKSLAGFSAASLRVATRALRQSSAGPDTGIGERLRACEEIYKGEILALRDGAEGIKAFLEKRKPVWEHR